MAISSTTPLFVFPMRNDLPQYSFNITLSGVVYNFQCLYNVRMSRWILNINDTSGDIILAGIPVLIQRNLYGQYATLSLPDGILFCTDDTGQDNQPTQFSFGVTNTMYYADAS